MVDNKKIAKNTIYMYVRMILVMAISLYTSRVVLNTLGVDDYGTYQVVGGIVGLLAFLNLTLNQGTSRFLMFELGKTSFSRETWLKALKKRFWTLFVPFVLWNIIAACFTIAFCRIKGLPSGLNFIRIFLNEGNPSTWMDVFGNTHTLCYPLDIPLWYIRDLIVLCVCSPIIYLLVKHVPKLFMVVLFFFAITGYNLDIIGFNYNAFLFFSIGSYVGIRQKILLS